MSFFKKLRLTVIISLIISIILSNISFASACEYVRENVLRLHILAASDSEADQTLKLKVRDALLKEGADIFDGSVDIDSAEEKIRPKIPFLESVAHRIINENGYDYDVKITLKREFFKTRTYGKTTLPAGRYLALRVIIENGEGHNWWCVMFPPLCLPAAVGADTEAVLGKKGTRLVSKNPKYEPRFKIVEIIEELRNDIR